MPPPSTINNQTIMTIEEDPLASVPPALLPLELERAELAVTLATPSLRELTCTPFYQTSYGDAHGYNERELAAKHDYYSSVYQYHAPSSTHLRQQSVALRGFTNAHVPRTHQPNDQLARFLQQRLHTIDHDSLHTSVTDSLKKQPYKYVNRERKEERDHAITWRNHSLMHGLAQKFINDSLPGERSRDPRDYHFQRQQLLLPKTTPLHSSSRPLSSSTPSSASSSSSSSSAFSSTAPLPNTVLPHRIRTEQIQKLEALDAQNSRAVTYNSEYTASFGDATNPHLWPSRQPGFVRSSIQSNHIASLTGEPPIDCERLHNLKYPIHRYVYPEVSDRIPHEKRMETGMGPYRSDFQYHIQRMRPPPLFVDERHGRRVPSFPDPH